MKTARHKQKKKKKETFPFFVLLLLLLLLLGPSLVKTRLMRRRLSQSERHEEEFIDGRTEWLLHSHACSGAMSLANSRTEIGSQTVVENGY